MPALPTFKKRLTDDSTLNLLQDNIKTIFTTLNQKDILNYAVLTNISLQSGLNLIPHTLNRPLTGWKTRRVRAQCRLWDSQDTAQYPSQYLYIHSDNAVVVDLEVF